MRTTSALIVGLLMPVLALAQPLQDRTTLNQEVLASPGFWYWVVALAIAVVAFIVSTAIVSRRGGPPHRRRTV